MRGNKPSVVAMPAARESESGKDQGNDLHRRPGGGISLSFDRETGSLAVFCRDAEFEILVDGNFCGIRRLEPHKLGIGRVNRIVDGDFAEPVPHWLIGAPGVASPVGRNLTADWTLDNGNTAYVAGKAAAGEAPVTATFHCPLEGPDLAIAAGEAYAFQACFGLHRCRATIRFVFTDAAGETVAVSEMPVETPAVGGRALRGYSRHHLVAKAPPDAARLRVELVKGPTLTGNDSFMFFTRAALCRASQAADFGQLHHALPVEVGIAMFARGGEPGYFGHIPVPDEALDGGWHKIGVKNRRTGELRTLPVAVPESLRARAEILGLEGAVLVCKLQLPASWTNPVGVSLWVDGAAVPGKIYSEPGTGMARLPLPVAACDGRPHVFEVRLGVSGQLLGQYACIGPASVTPWEALQHYAGMPLPAHLAPLAAYRYASLAAAAGPIAADLHDILLEGFERPRRAFRPLPFPAVADPDVSVVIPVHNKFDVTYVCLAALLFAATRASFEVIVVDDGSSDTTTRLPEIAPGIVYLRNEKPQGFVGACNAGAARARGRHIVFLNNDTEPTAHWLDELLFVFRTFDEVGLAGSKLIYPDGTQQEAGGIVWDTGDPWNYGRRGNPHDPRYSYTRICDYLSGAAIMIPAELWRELGGFSREFEPAYFEDTDLAFKVKQAGRKVVFVPHSVVVHYEGLSNGTDQSAATGLKRFQEINRPKFKRKWAGLFEGNGRLGVNPDLVKDRGIKRRVLFIDYEVPHLDRDAGSYAAVQEIRLFQALGCKVTFLPLNMAYLGRHTEFLQRIGVEAIHLPFSASAAAFLQSRGSEFDLVYITRYGVAEQVVGLLSEHAPQARVIVNVADLHFLRQIRDALSESSPDKMKEALLTRDAELAALSRAELILSYSPVEQAVITSHITSGAKAGIVPWVIDTAPLNAPFAGRRDIAFFGGFRHYPNVNAVKHFVRDVMPLLRARLPGVRFLIYGSNVPPDIEALAAPDIVVKGYVADVAEIFDTCRVFVAPLLTGAGMKGKVLDCLAAGIPSVLSPIAAEGIAIRDGIDAIVARTPEDWVAGIAALYQDEAAWTAMSKAAHDLARRNYSFAAAVTALSEALALIDVHATAGKPALCANRARPEAPRHMRPAPAEPESLIPANPLDPRN